MTLILRIAGAMIRAGSISLSLAKYQREFCVVEIFCQPIPIAYMKTPVFLHASQLIHVLEVAYISGGEKDNKDEYDNSIIPTGIYFSVPFSSFSTELFYQDPEFVTLWAQKALDEDF